MDIHQVAEAIAKARWSSQYSDGMTNRLVSHPIQQANKTQLHATGDGEHRDDVHYVNMPAHYFPR
jgi:hypothetical protein